MKKSILIICFSFVFFGCIFNKLVFNAEVWKDPMSYKYRAHDITERQKMLDSVLKVINGKSRNEIIDLLGSAEDTGYFRESGRDLLYILGPERGIGVDMEWLLLWFDQDNILVKYQVCTD